MTFFSALPAVLLLLFCFHCSDAFLKPKKAPPPGKPKTPGSSGKACLDKNSKNYPGAGYGSGGPVADPKKLSCDFKKPCCWRPGDAKKKIKFYNGDPAKCIKNAKFAKGKYGVHAGKAKEITFESCSILCSEGPVKLTAEYGRTKNVKLVACTKASFSKQKPKGCKPMKSRKPVTLPKGEIFDVVIKATGFKTGSDALLLRKIKVDYKPCRSPAADKLCEAKCAMDGKGKTAGKGKLCAWKNKGKRSFVAYDTNQIVGNADTGVNADHIIKGKGAKYPAVSKGPFAALGMNPRDVAMLSIDSLTIEEDMLMMMEVYEACDQAHIEVCSDGQRCQKLTEKGAKLEDRQWKKVKYPIKKGTKKVEIKAISGDYYCAAGITNVDFATSKKRTESFCKKKKPQKDSKKKKGGQKKGGNNKG